jgi:hypothetical protein
MMRTSEPPALAGTDKSGWTMRIPCTFALNPPCLNGILLVVLGDAVGLS